MTSSAINLNEWSYPRVESTKASRMDLSSQSHGVGLILAPLLLGLRVHIHLAAPTPSPCFVYRVVFPRSHLHPSHRLHGVILSPALQPIPWSARSKLTTSRLGAAWALATCDNARPQHQGHVDDLTTYLEQVKRTHLWSFKRSRLKLVT
jgi:hypothetical protein